MELTVSILPFSSFLWQTRCFVGNQIATVKLEFPGFRHFDERQRIVRVANIIIECTPMHTEVTCRPADVVGLLRHYLIEQSLYHHNHTFFLQSYW